MPQFSSEIDDTQPARRRGRARWRAVLAAALAAFLAGLVILFTALYALLLIPTLSQLREAHRPDLNLATIAYTADGQELARYYREHRRWVGHSQISPHVIDALVATEDHRFYRHAGVDGIRLLAATFQTARGNRQGGSTITMQLARNLYPGIGRAAAYERKLKEVVMALKLERAYSKEQILEMYLNTVPFGYNAFGIEAAARTYYNKRADQLSVAESATLVGMLKGPTRYNPLRHPDLARQRRTVVLQQMVRRGYLREADARPLRGEALDAAYTPSSVTSSPAPYFAEFVRAWLHEWAEQSGYDLYADGLRVYTTLDARLQALAQEAVRSQTEGLQAVVDYEWSRAAGFYLGDEAGIYERHKREGRFEPFSYFWRTHPDLRKAFVRRTARYRNALRHGAAAAETLDRLQQDEAFMDSLKAAKTRLEAGFVALDPHTGHVKAWVGGRNFEQDQYDKVALARRQPGSTFKPFLYGAAVDHGYSPYHLVSDSPAVSLRDGLAYSVNRVAARLMDVLGPSEVIRFAHRAGIQSRLVPVPSLALGTSEVTLLEMVSAYGTFAAGGVHRPPLVVTRIEDRHGRVLAMFEPAARKVISQHTAYTVVDMMRGVIQRGTGTRLRQRFGIEADVAGKTGTTQQNADGWFILMHPRLVVGAWVGFNDRRVTFRSDRWGRGGHNALHLVGDFMRRVQAEEGVHLPALRFLPPPGYRQPEPSPEGEGTFTYGAVLDDGRAAQPYMRNAFREGLARDTAQRRAAPPAPGPMTPEEASMLPDADPEAALRRAVEQPGR